MKWIGQNIYDLIARFRNDVYLENISTGTIASGGNLGLDSNNKIVKATEASGDITGVSITTDSGGGSKAEDTGGSADFSILGASGVGVTNSGTTITATSVPGEIDHDSLLNFAANEHFTQANITTVGTIGTGVWQGTAIASAYLDADTAHLTTDQTFTGKKTFSSAVTFNGDTATFSSANADDPVVIIENTTVDDQAARLQFKKHRGVDAVDGDNIGEIEFWGYDDGTPSIQLYGKITTEIHDATSGQESGTMYLIVASHDGGNNTGVKLTGGSVDNEVDVEIAQGAASVTTVKGTLTMGSTATINNSGVIQVAAQTVIDHDQLANFAANEHYTQANITTVGTIGTGVWNGTAIATDQQKHLAYFTFKGFSTSDGTNYEAIDSLNDGNAPYEHNSPIGSDGLTAQTVQTFMRMGGTVMPYAGTIKSWTGWATSAGSGTIDLGLFKYTPTRNNNSNVAAVLLKNTQFTALGNAKMEDFAETSFSVAFAAGDMIVSAIKGGTSGKIAFFDSTLEVEWN